MIREKHITLCFSLFLALSMVLGQLIPVAATDEIPAEEPQAEETVPAAEEPAAEPEPEVTAEEEPGVVPIEGTDPVQDEQPADEGQAPAESGEAEEPVDEYSIKTVKTQVGNAEITAVYDSNSGLPEEAAFRAEEVTGDTANIYKDWSNSALEGDITFAQFFDIWFEHNGEAVQPVPGTVKISIQYPDSLEKSSNEEVSVVHFPDDAAIEVLNEAKIDQTETEVKTVELAAASFSVYGIVGTEKPVIEYTFFAPTAIDAHGTATYGKYEYTDKAGNKVDTQFVADGSTIEYPGKPVEGFDDYVFENWYYGTYNENGDPIPGDTVVDFEAPVEVTERSKQPIMAKYVQAKYGVFYDDADGTVVLAHVRYVDGKIAAGAVSATPSQANTAFVGWSTEKGGSTPITLDEDGNYTGTATHFYPIFKEAYTLTFSTGEGSYVKPQTVEPDKNPVKPEDPHRTGYTFGGWYADAECTTTFDFNTPLAESKTVFAKWNPAQTSYTVIYWLQSIHDLVNTNPKTYEYSSSEVKKGNTGSQIQITDADISNHKPDGNVTYAKKDGQTEIKGDGSTVVNVYYDRSVITFNFGGHGSLKGLYGTSFEQNGLTCPEGPWKTGKWLDETTYPFITHFIDPGGQGRTIVNFTKASTGRNNIQIYLQNIDGSYANKPNVEQPMSANTGWWTFTEVINGYTVDSYKNGNQWIKVSEGQRITIPSENFQIRYRRNEYTMKFLNGAKDYANKQILYEDSIAKHLGDLSTPSYPGHPDDADQYVFVGWFADPQCTTLVNFGDKSSGEIANIQSQWGIQKVADYKTMPASDLEVYAGWFRKQFNVKLNPNGGTISEALPLAFKASYGDELAGDYFSTPVREGYSLVGWAKTETIPSGAPEFWNPVEQVVGDVDLTAIWKANGSFTVKYFDEDYKDELQDLNTDEKFADSSSVSVKKPSESHVPENKVFHGWFVLDRDGKQVGSILKPGESFAIDAASMARNGNEIHIKMATTAPGTTTLVYHKNDGSAQDTTVSVTDIAVNTNISSNKKKPIIQLPDDWKRDGYEFVGWNTKKDGTGEMFQPDDIDYAVNANNPNDLYAQYRRVLTVTVKKTVDGNFGDRLKSFNFTASGSGITNDADKSFDLRHGNEKQIKVYENETIDLAETPVEGYNTEIKVSLGNSSSTTSGTDLKNLVITEDTIIEFVNTKNGTVPTGLNGGDLIPYLGAVILGLGAAIVYVLSIRRKQLDR